MHLLQQEYKLLAAEGASVERRREVIEQLARIAPRAPAINYYRISEYSHSGDIAGMYRVAGDWIGQDKQRRQLPIIRGLFEPVRGEQ